MTCPKCGKGDDVRAWKCGGVVVLYHCELCDVKWTEPPISVSTRQE